MESRSLCSLDEPNSNLDTQGELALLKAIQKLKEKGSTVVIITHKKDILKITDLIAVLKDGTLNMVWTISTGSCKTWTY